MLANLISKERKHCVYDANVAKCRTSEKN